VKDLLLGDTRYELIERSLEVNQTNSDVNLLGRGELGEVVLRSQREGMGRCRVGSFGVDGSWTSRDKVRSKTTARSALKSTILEASSRGGRTRLTDPLINLLRLPRHRLEHRVRAQRVKVCAGVVERTLFGDSGEVEVRLELELPGEGFEDVQLGLMRVRKAEVEHSVESGYPFGARRDVSESRRAFEYTESRRRRGGKKKEHMYLPGRRRAGSRRSGRLVAPMTKTSAEDLPEVMPSSSARSWETIRSITPPAESIISRRSQLLDRLEGGVDSHRERTVALVPSLGRD
jgi:hypothetical protein